MKPIAWVILVGSLLLTEVTLAQRSGQDAEYDAFVRRWSYRFAPWGRFKPDELRAAEPMLQKLRRRYPTNEWLKYVELRLLAEKQDWQSARAILDTPPRPKGVWSDRWRLHVYWQQGDYRSVLWSDASRRYFPFRLWCLFLPTAIFLYGWRLSRITGSPAILAAVTLPLVMSALALPYHWLAGIVVSGAPYPIAYLQEQVCDLLYDLLLFGTLFIVAVLLLRKYGQSLVFTPLRANWLAAGAVTLLVAHGVWQLSPSLWHNPNALVTLFQEAGTLNLPGLAQVGVRLFVQDVSMALLYVMLAYRAARSRLPFVPAFAFALLVTLSTPNSWWELEQGLAMLRFTTFWVAPALMMYERYGRVGVTLIAFWWSTVTASLGSLLLSVPKVL